MMLGMVRFVVAGGVGSDSVGFGKLRLGKAGEAWSGGALVGCDLVGFG